MADVIVTAPVVPVSPASKKTVTKKVNASKKAPVKSNHPPTSDMVNAAIAAQKEKKGSSLQAIKKYISTTYKVDVDKQSTFIKKYLKSAVTKKTIVQTKGSGASGRFKLATKSESEKMAKKPVAQKPVIVVDQKKPTAKKTTVVKKPTTTKKTPSATIKSKVAKPTKPKSPSKTKKSGKALVTKPKTPKPKKTTTAAKPKPVKK